MTSDAQLVGMIAQIIALSALLASKPRMVVIQGLLLLPHLIVSFPRHRCHLRSLRRIVQDALRFLLTWTLSKKFRLTVDLHRPVLVIHTSSCRGSG